MDRKACRTRHLGLVVAVLLVAHLWMLAGSTGHAPSIVDHMQPAPTATSNLPTAGACPTGMIACVSTVPDPEPLAFVPLLALDVVTVLVPLRRLARHASRHDRRHPPPRPSAHSSVVLLQ